MIRLLSLFIALFLIALGLATASVLPLSAVTLGKQTGLPVPRYVSLSAQEVNVRTGPGGRYPIAWVFQRRSLPVEVVAEFDTWRKIRDFEGTQGWVHQSMLSGRRTVLVIGELRALRHDPSSTASAVARLEPGVLARLEGCRPEWCEIKVSGLFGWISRAHIWGVGSAEGND